MKNLARLGACLIAMCLVASGALAGSNSATLDVRAMVLAYATINGATLDFGAYTSGQGAVQAQVGFDVQASNNTPYSITLGNGASYSDSTRHMTGPSGDLLAYSLYQDSGCSNPWDMTNYQTGTGNGLAKTYTVYGKIPAGQWKEPGAYSDSVVMTVNF